MIKLEQKMLPELQPYTQERAEKLIDLLQSKGTTIARSHCNIEPVSGLKNLQNLQAVLARRQAGFECEIVAFPQHGLLLSKSEPLMREAMQAGAHYVGGWTRPVLMARWKNPSIPCSRLRWTTTKASIFTCTKHSGRCGSHQLYG
ncbi:deaminase [Escherichia coli]|uniref:Deaminase n=1 Tax=Escherichia coli TaxID=562 RepID=A0A2X1KSN3_ECOLX|nr:deaminase [Escherichia coli]